MSNIKHILTVQSKNILKEIAVSPNMASIKVGTEQNSDVRLKSELFKIPIEIWVNYSNGAWMVSCNDKLNISSHTKKNLEKATIQHGDILSITDKDSNEELLTLIFSYDFTVSETNFDTIIDIRKSNTVTIGKSPNAQIRLENQFVGAEYITLMRNQNGNLTIDASNAKASATLNGIRIFEAQAVSEYDFVGIADYLFYYRNQVLYTTSRNDLLIKGLSVTPLRNETIAFNYPKLNRSPRLLYEFDKKPIEILNPPEKPEKPKENIVIKLMPMLLMIGVVVVIQSGMIGGTAMGGPQFMIMAVASMSVGLMTSILAFVHSKKQYKKNLAEWKSDYKNYIENKQVEIQSAHGKELRALIDLYPDVEQTREFVKTFSGRLFERCLEDSDFLHVRVGLGAIPAMRKPTFKNEEKVKTDNELMPIPEQLCDRYEHIENAPVMLHMRESGNIGVVGTNDEQYEFFKHLILDVCVQHYYEDVQIIVMLPQEDREKYRWIKWLPHIKESGGDLRGIVCSEENKDDIFEHMYALMANRSASGSSSADDGVELLPYYIVFVIEEYSIKTHPLFNFAENCSSLGFSFVYFKNYMENLPQFCQEIVQLNQGGGVIRIKDNKEYACHFVKEPINDESIKFVTERLAPVFCEKIALASNLTANISLFELLNIITPKNLDLKELWKKSNVKKSLAAPLGVNAKGETVFLDLHEKAHGPHGLVAGTTGSGKSEIMQSYILAIAANFHPFEVAFVIIDFKGGGMANQFDGLPHLIGKITDIDNHEINRSLQSIRAELEKRKRLFAEFYVNHIDDYIAKFQSGAAKIPLPHLVLIVDEFAELKAEQPEFMKELISTARVGRSLGIHLILATQKPSGQVNEQIWSNSRFKLCLKVATKEDSNEVLRTPLASEIREPGRAYLQVGNNEIFTLFQSAYSGASAVSDKYGNIREFEISEVDFTGKRTVVIERKAERTSDGEKITQLKAMVEYVATYCKNAGITGLPSICPPPLPNLLAFKKPDRIIASSAQMLIGIYDDPENQAQPDVILDLSIGNVVLIGAAQTGKTMLLQTILRAIAETSSPKQISVYILDFASRVLKTYENLNHVGGILTDADDERLKSFFKMMVEEMESRKEHFSQLGISSYDAYLEMESEELPSMPRIVIMLDNIAAFREMYQDSYEDTLLNICREGLALGITVIATSKQAVGVSYKFLSNFETRIAFHCSDSAEYGSIFDRCNMQPKDVPGRGLVSIDKSIFECQTFLAFDTETESQRNEQVAVFISGIAKKYPSEHARKIPEIPAILLNDYWVENQYTFNNYVVPVGLSYSDIEPVKVDLLRTGAIGIYGKDGFGKSNLIRVIMNHLQNNVFRLPCKAYLIDSYDKQFSEYESYGFVENYSTAFTDFLDIIQEFSHEAENRLKMLQSEQVLENEPLMLCIVRNPQLFTEGSIPYETAEIFKKLLSDAKQMKQCFIFAEVDNNPDYSAPEMMRLAREFNQIFLLDDLANVKLFGTGKFNITELREFSKPLTLGEGYLYDSRDKVEKVKFVKCDRRGSNVKSERR